MPDFHFLNGAEGIEVVEVDAQQPLKNVDVRYQ